MQRHVVLDTSFLTAGLWEKTVGGEFCGGDEEARIGYIRRARSVVRTSWPRIKLHIPQLCYAEALTTISKSGAQYGAAEEAKQASSELAKLIDQGRLDLLPFEKLQMQLLQEHILPLNHVGTEPPMVKTADCLVAAAGMQLAWRVGQTAVLVATGDKKQHKLLRLLRNDAQAGCPDCIYMVEATSDELIAEYAWWPLPTKRLQTARRRLHPAERVELVGVYEKVKSHYESHSLVPEVEKLTVDNLPYTWALEAVCILFAERKGLILSDAQAFRELLRARKAKEMSEKDA